MNRRSTIGGAVTAFGLVLMGAGQLPDKDIDNIRILWYVSFAGFILTALGAFLTALFAADARNVRELSKQVTANTSNIATTASAVQSGDTAHLKRDMVEKD